MMNNELQRIYLVEALQSAKGLTIDTEHDAELVKLQATKPDGRVVVPMMRAEKKWKHEIEATPDLERLHWYQVNTGNLVHTGWTLSPEHNVANAIIKLNSDKEGIDGYIADLESIGFDFSDTGSELEDRNVI
ncbi:hypothetical protein A3A64_00135 [Candidatus Gottesmanbacteria bacterium RIFCSPLOWO2_01_FULL_48_11]|uniref:Uncharacterized protein n=3 Tax=Candidatus Gottesmaniibacteriota TaxID=1752720 RepID=A0A0G1UMX7_9BACT|nr:MAG: hypothetical protein UY16_C0044G0006 [Candidatus Gottesmanbacteria bacterium GW2011_GWA2_47_9]KKU95451.1 MAG: hypothetical protein UY27_C0017G0006 [Candidatus Gottesmanbacteria bacterium GW2011_GWA1_48_13]OGG28200.1 MAG: hypothetical protein A3A64_00135 [Candidatus Gottesmanbacteria bacterium RIFCSPLOWO2_01_FULL_48_11]